jgi:hypothetical protein
LHKLYRPAVTWCVSHALASLASTAADSALAAAAPARSRASVASPHLRAASVASF